MVRILCALIFLLSVTTATAREGYVGATDYALLPHLKRETVIKEGHGGIIATSLMILDVVEKNGYKIIVDGPCASACTFFLMLEPKNFCWTDRASFQFHSSWYKTKDGKVRTDVKVNAAMKKMYGVRVRAWLDRSKAYDRLELTILPRSILVADYGSKRC